jgi:hypothetical protein
LKLKLPKLSSEDIIALRAMCSTARLIKKHDLAYEEELAQVQRNLLKEQEKVAPANALLWWFNASGNKLAADLSRWRLEFRWEHTRAGWRGFRFLKGRQCYASRPMRQFVGLEKRPDDNWIRMARGRPHVCLEERLGWGKDT